MPTETSRAEFEALIARSGLPLREATKESVFAVMPKLDALRAMIRTPAPGPAAEPSNVFTAAPAESGR